MAGWPDVMEHRRTSSLTKANLCCPVPHWACAHALHVLPPCVHQQLRPTFLSPPPPPAPRLWPGSRHTVLDVASLSPGSLSVRLRVDQTAARVFPSPSSLLGKSPKARLLCTRGAAPLPPSPTSWPQGPPQDPSPQLPPRGRPPLQAHHLSKLCLLCLHGTQGRSQWEVWQLTRGKEAGGRRGRSLCHPASVTRMDPLVRFQPGKVMLQMLSQGSRRFKVTQRDQASAWTLG